MEKTFTITDDRITLENNESISFGKAIGQNGVNFLENSTICLSVVTSGAGGERKDFIKFNSFLNQDNMHATIVNMAPTVVTNLGANYKTEIIITNLKGNEQVFCEYLKSSSKIVPLPPNQNPFQVR